MPIQFSKAEVIAKNNIAIEACDVAIARLESIVGLDVEDDDIRLAQLDRAGGQKDHLESINENLRAALTVVRPLSNQAAAELNHLGNKLDQQIRTDAIINASISFITSVLNDVSRLRDITNSAKS